MKYPTTINLRPLKSAIDHTLETHPADDFPVYTSLDFSDGNIRLLPIRLTATDFTSPASFQLHTGFNGDLGLTL
jgi:hypothetical protein